MSRKTTDFAHCLHTYFNNYLNKTYYVSQNTISSYSYTFTLLLKFFQSEQKLLPQKIKLEHFNRQIVLGFLLWLEETRNNSISTRNQRLAAIHSFCRFVQADYPECFLHMQQILSIPMKKAPAKCMNFLSHDGIKLLFEKPDVLTKQGRRDLMLLTLLYDTGARASEITEIRIGDLFLESPASVRLLGKGRKYRQIPLMAQTVKMLKYYLAENKRLELDETSQHLFLNLLKEKLSRGGITHILQKYCSLAHNANPQIVPAKLSPHCLRHSKAMHLLQSGVNLIYIRDFLGHADISTTEVYAKADPEMKRNALEKAYKQLSPDTPSNWAKDTELMDWLKELGKT